MAQFKKRQYLAGRGYGLAVLYGRALTLAAVLLGAVGLAGCGSSDGSAADTSNRETTSTTFACGPEQDDCTPTEVTATVTRIYENGGASAAEAKCLAPITSQGKSSVNQAFEVPLPGETAAAVECVGSEERLRAITQGVADYFASLQPSS